MTILGILADFVVIVVFMTFMRMFYSIPLLLVRPSIRRVGWFVIIVLVFGSMEFFVWDKALGAKVEGANLRIYYAWPKADVVEPITDLPKPITRSTGAVSVVEYSNQHTFLPVYNFDSSGIASLAALKKMLVAAPAAAAIKQR